jgi:pyrimidine deaminase RibD-like protein
MTTRGSFDSMIRDAVAFATSVPCDHAGMPPVCPGCAERVARVLAVKLDHAADLLNRWLSQHRDGGASDPCGVSAELVSETRKALEQ